MHKSSEGVGSAVNELANGNTPPDEIDEDELLSDDGQSVDLSEISNELRNVTDEELLEIMASKHRYEDDGKIFHIAIIDYLQDWNCSKKAETMFKPIFK